MRKKKELQRKRYAMKSKWNEGFPEKRGIYKCKVDGKETVLTHHKCNLSGKHRWSTVDGYDVIADKIEWSEDPVM